MSQPRTPTHIVEDINDIIKKESNHDLTVPNYDADTSEFHQNMDQSNLVDSGFYSAKRGSNKEVRAPSFGLPLDSREIRLTSSS